MFETLGINFVVRGMSTVARDVSHVASSFYKFSSAVERVERAAVRSATAQNRLATSIVDRTARAMDSLNRRSIALQNRLNSLQVTQLSLLQVQGKHSTTISDYNAKVGGLSIVYNELQQAQQRLTTYHSNWTKKIQQEKQNISILEDAIKLLEDQIKDLEPAYQKAVISTLKLSNTNDKITQTTDELIDTQQKLQNLQKQQPANIQGQQNAYNNLNSVLQMVGVNTNTYQRMLNVLTGKMGGASGAAGGFNKILGLTQPQLLAIALALDVMKLALNLVVGAIKLFVGVMKIAFNILKKVATVVWNVIKAVGTGLWNAFKKIISLPLKLLTGSFNSLGGSLQRVFEIAIGMNLSRIWWGIGQKFRELAKMIFDSGVDFQVTFLRIRGLMTQELLRSDSALEYADAIALAGEKAKELVTWVSMTGIQTIYDAEDILDVTALAMAYGFTSEAAKTLTKSVLDFATGMGLEDVAMKRIIENFGQLRAQGKITGTELRDLARGSFVPVTDVLERMAERLGIVADYDVGDIEDISAVFEDMRESGELTEESLKKIGAALEDVSADGLITRTEFENVVDMFNISSSELQKNFGLTKEQANKAIEGIKTGELADKLNDWIKAGGQVEEFFLAFEDIVAERFPNAAASAGTTMKALVSNVGDYIRSMFGWRIVSPVLGVIAEKVQNFVTGTLMSEKQVRIFDTVGLALKNLTTIVVESFTPFDNFLKMFSSSKIRIVGRELIELFSMLGEGGAYEDVISEKINNLTDFLGSVTSIDEGQLSRFQKGLWTLVNAFWDTVEGRDRPGALGEDWGFGTIIDALKDVLGPVWDGVIKPEIDKWWEKIKARTSEKISDWWNNTFLPKLNEFKTETLMPALKTFFTETLPGWIKTASDYISEKGPTIVEWVSTTLYNALKTLHDWAITATGENSALSLLIGYLASLAGYANIKIFEDGISDVEAAEISGYADAVRALSDNLAEFLTPVKNVFEGDFGEKFSKFVDNIEALVGFLSALGQFVGAVFNLAGAILGLGLSLITFGNFDSQQSGFITLMNFITGIGETKAGIINLVADAINFLSDGIKNLKSVFSGGIVFPENLLPEDITEFLWPSVPEMKGDLEKIGAGLTKAFIGGAVTEANGGSWGTQLNNAIIEGLEKPVDWLAPSTEQNWADLGANLTIDFAKGFNQSIEETEVDATPLASKITTGVTNAFDDSATGLKLELPERLFTGVGENVVSGINKGFSSEWDLFRNNVESLIPEIDKIIKDYFLIESPSRLMAEIGEDLVSGLQAGTQEEWGIFIAWWTNAIAVDMGILTANMYTAGSNIINGLWNGLENRWEDLKEWWAEVCVELSIMFAKLNQITSPSKVFMGYGENIMAGLAEGLTSGAENVRDAMRFGAMDIQKSVGAINNVNKTDYNYSTVNTNNWNVGVTTPIHASTMVQAYEILRLRAR